MSFTSEPATNAVVQAFARSAAAAGDLRGHRIVTDPTAADCLLFVDLHLCPDPALAALFAHPLVKAMPEKVLVYDERDEPWCAFPGVYVSMPLCHFDPARMRAFGYYGELSGTAIAGVDDPDLLFSFVGTPGHVTSGGHRVRRALLSLTHPRAIVEDSSGFVFYDDQGDPEAHRQRQRRFGEVISRSKFVLCPRGRGTSSIRMYETLRAGRVPVVLADEWVAPPGPDWKACSLRVAERDAGRVPEMLEASEHRWLEMSAAAQETYASWFTPGVVVHRIFDLCEELLAAKPRQVPRWRDPSYRAMRLRCIRQAGRRLAGASLRAIRLRK